MKVVILAGGRGTRMGNIDMPKPMVTIGGIPMLRHIMNWYAKFDHTEFIVLGGYQVAQIFKYVETMEMPNEDWIVDVVDTGVDTPTGQRLLNIQDRIKDDTFMVTYGDGIGNVNINALYRMNPRASTGIITAVNPPGRFGTLYIGDNNKIYKFNEKQKLTGEWVNGGFMLFTTDVFKYIENNEMLEFGALPRLAEEGLLEAYEHKGFWQCLDTMRDKEYLEEVWTWKRCYWR